LSTYNRKNAYYSVPLKKSLRLRLTVINVAAVVMLGAIVLGIVYNVLERRMETEYVAKGKAIARTVACMVNGEMVDRYLSTLETDAEYETMLSHLRTMQTEYGLLYVCVIRMAKDGEVLVFGTGEVEEGTSALGMFISWVDSFGEGHDDYINALLRGEQVGPLVSNGVYGSILSAYEPIYRVDKSVAAYACVDISMDQLKRDETVMFMLACIGVMSVLVMTIAAGQFTFRKYIVSPVRILLDQSESFHAVGSGSAQETPLQPRLKLGDELAFLERAIIDMELRIRAEVAERLRAVKQAQTEAEKIYFDSLTDIYNRRYLDENLKRVISSLSRSGAALSLMMIDIDYFKKYNDTYGHTKGDECLKTVAATLKSGLTRADDFVVRYGGEEFAVVLPNTDESGARLIADKLLKNIQNQAIPHETSDAADRVTISIGVTSGAVKHTHSADYWLRLADEMLYKSKQEGRNKYNFETADG
jgi:diguanylate cyclase (GGDEF)-like protein